MKKALLIPVLIFLVASCASCYKPSVLTDGQTTQREETPEETKSGAGAETPAGQTQTTSVPTPDPNGIFAELIGKTFPVTEDLIDFPEPVLLGEEFVYHDLLSDHADNDSRLMIPNVGRYSGGEAYFLIDNGFWKYDFRSGAFCPACTDPGCTHKNTGCITDRFPIDPTYEQMSYTVIFQASFEKEFYFTVERTLFCYNKERSCLEIFARFPEMVSGVQEAFADGENLYFPVWELEGVENNKNVYCHNIYRVNVKTGKMDAVTSFGRDNPEIYSIENGRIYYRIGTCIYEAKLDLSEKIELFATPFYRLAQVSQGKLIYSKISELWDNLGFKACNIYSYDLSSGEELVITGDRVITYFVTERYIYYIPRFDGCNYFKLMRIDHDGRNRIEVMKFLNFKADSSDHINAFYVEGDYLLGYFPGSASYVVYDLTTGAYMKLGTDEWYK